MSTLKQTAADKILELLRGMQQEVEAFRVKLSLGKMDAEDAYHELRKDFKPLIREFRKKLENAREYSEERLEQLRGKIDALEAGVEAGRHDDAKEKVEFRLLQLKQQVLDLQTLLKGGKTQSETAVTLGYRLQTLALKLTILWLLYRWGKVEMQHGWELRQKQLDEKMASLKVKLEEKKESMENWWQHVADETEHLLVRMRHLFEKTDKEEKA